MEGEVLEENVCVSVIIPVYNSQRTLERTLNSVLGQTIKNIEVIIVDDGSRDKSREIINRFKNKDNRIKLISQKNLGVSSARNKGIEIARGEYIAFVDSDDYIDINMIGIMYNTAIQFNSDVVCIGMIMESVYGNVEILPSTERLLINSEEEKIKKIYIEAYIDGNRKGFSECCNKLYKKEVLKNNNIVFNEKKTYGEDYEFNLCVFTNVLNIIILPCALYFYNRKNDDSSTRKYMDNMLSTSINGYKTKIEYCDRWNLSTINNINKINWQFFLTIKACISNEARGNGKTSIKERKKYINEIKQNSVVKNSVNQLINSNMTIGRKIQVYVFIHLHSYSLLYLYLFKEIAIKGIKSILKVINKKRGYRK